MKSVYLDQNVFGHMLDKGAWKTHPIGAVLEAHAEVAGVWISPTRVLDLSQATDLKRRVDEELGGLDDERPGRLELLVIAAVCGWLCKFNISCPICTVIPRYLEGRLLAALQVNPAVALMGPRQVGKTILIGSTLREPSVGGGMQSEVDAGLDCEVQGVQHEVLRIAIGSKLVAADSGAVCVQIAEVVQHNAQQALRDVLPYHYAPLRSNASRRKASPRSNHGFRSSHMRMT